MQKKREADGVIFLLAFSSGVCFFFRNKEVTHCSLSSFYPLKKNLVYDIHLSPANGKCLTGRFLTP